MMMTTTTTTTTTTITTKILFPLIIVITINLQESLSNNVRKSIETTVNCRERNRLIQNDKNDLYRLVDAIIEEKIILQCHYCKENDDEQPKIWYKINNFTTLNYQQVQLDMNNDPNKNRIYTNIEHSLIINNFTNDDIGLYTCQRLNDENVGEKHNYFVDLAFDSNLTEITGNLSDWLKYNEDYFQTINEQFKNAQTNEFRLIRDQFNLEMEIITEWNEWSSCQICGSLLKKDHGIKTKLGLCRIKIIIKNKLINQPIINDTEILLKRLNMFGCHSVTFSRILPGISNMTRIIPNFIQTQPCEGICNPDSESLDRGWKTSNSSDFKYRTTIVLSEGEHKNFICPKATLENVVIWKKNGKILESGKFLSDNPDTMVDTFNTIYFTNIKLTDEANYTCEVDNVKMQRIMLFVATKSKLFDQIFIRYIIYLTMILSLILPCYIAGLIIACSRRHFFKNYQQLKDDEIEFEGVLTTER